MILFPTVFQIRNCKSVVLQDLESTLAEQVPQSQDLAGMQELPPLSIDGIPTSVDKMTQVRRNFFMVWSQIFIMP